MRLLSHRLFTSSSYPLLLHEIVVFLWQECQLMVLWLEMMKHSHRFSGDKQQVDLVYSFMNMTRFSPTSAGRRRRNRENGMERGRNTRQLVSFSLDNPTGGFYFLIYFVSFTFLIQPPQTNTAPLLFQYYFTTTTTEASILVHLVCWFGVGSPFIGWL